MSNNYAEIKNALMSVEIDYSSLINILNEYIDFLNINDKKLCNKLNSLIDLGAGFFDSAIKTVFLAVVLGNTVLVFNDEINYEKFINEFAPELEEIKNSQYLYGLFKEVIGRAVYSSYDLAKASDISKKEISYRMSLIVEN